MSKIILITRPNHDLTTNYLYFWSEAVINITEKHNLTILDLNKNKANKKNFDSYIKNKHPNFIFLNGHGSETEITGYDNEVLIDSSDNKAMVTASIIYARSCDSGKILGKVLVDNGAGAFIGYKRKFVFLYNPDYSTKPQKDSVAKIFLEPSNLIPSTIIKGHSAGDAHNRAKESMLRTFRKLLLSSSDSEERYCASHLWSNIKCQVLLGDPETKM